MKIVNYLYNLRVNYYPDILSVVNVTSADIPRLFILMGEHPSCLQLLTKV